MFQLSTKTVVSLDAETLARCRELSYGDEGYMCEDLDRILATEPVRKRPPYRMSHACLVHMDGKIVGWSLIEPIPRSPRYTVQMFVDPKHRGMGIGTELLRHAKAWSGKRRPVAYVDNENCGFFDKHPNLYSEV